MELSGNTILITGGATGIGLAFASRLLEAGNRVIVVGRREDKLNDAKAAYPELIIKACDVSNEQDRLALVEWVLTEHPEVNVLVNNAGIQQRVNVARADKDWPFYQNEIAINVEGPIHLSLLLVPHFQKQKRAAIINVSSGLAIRPGGWVPIYSATKAAIHSFTQSLRLQMEDSSVRVIEVLPPAVNTDLGGSGLHTFGAPLDDFADSVVDRIKRGDLEIGYGDSEQRLHMAKAENDLSAKAAWDNFRKNNPDF
ncbi:SDR family oxidoreductase [Planococcus sp. YIM B11945]|uniref:SDR family oxidoreductase n=1 Tax=Planococcus sp. YIM B11945 TaxID=3435410 RepID=UPI003D7D69A4